ncbi:hypothetical protein LTR37_002674 [Vermiconidia calcicola]|uniref:Uncharacterized protein n=1 Tax=Vermiconidia calcicola TaxID=1690605 RepID=A0ACC3NSP0_9PEZI|nr:hypothetical protein LTR37_002674 [Vermiconidia calcicola]
MEPQGAGNGSTSGRAQRDADERLAQQLQDEELAQQLQDLELAEGFQHIEEQDGRERQEFSTIDERYRRGRARQIASDHELALYLDATKGLPAEAALHVEEGDGAEPASVERTLRELNERIHERDEPVIAESSNAAARRGEEPREGMAYCDTCSPAAMGPAESA